MMLTYYVRVADDHLSNFHSNIDRMGIESSLVANGWVSAHQKTSLYKMQMSKEDELLLKLSTTLVGSYCPTTEYHE